MLRGELTGLRAQTDRDIEIFETELLTDLHNRHAEIGLVLRPAFRGRHLGTDVVRVLSHYGFAVRGLHRLQITALAGNHAMITAAVRAGFVLEGTTRDAAWIDGGFADGVILSLLFPDWPPGPPADDSP